MSNKQSLQRFTSLYGFLLLIFLASVHPFRAHAQIALQPSNEVAFFYGSSVSIAGDYAAVGTRVFGRGAYIFRREGDTWVEDLGLETINGSSVGEAIAITDGYAIFGSSGKAFLLRLDDDEWELDGQVDERVISGSQPSYADAVDISGEQAIVGAWLDSDGGSSAGAVYIYRRINGVWTEEAKLLGSEVNGHLGESVSISGDVAIASSNQAAHIYRWDGAEWAQEAELTAGLPFSLTKFGVTSVSIHGNYAVVGAQNATSENSTTTLNGGAVYIFEYDGTEWDEVDRVSPQAPSDNNFGHSVHVIDSFFVAGTFEDFATPGGAYVFRQGESSWEEIARLDIQGEREDSLRIGASVAISETDIVVGAEGIFGNTEGSAFVFPISASGFMAPALEYPNETSTDVFTSPILRWSAINGAASYDVEIATDAAFTSIVASAEKNLDNTILIQDLDAGASYYWRVRSNGILASSAWSPTSFFTVALAGPVTIGKGSYEGTWSATYSPYMVQGNVNVAYGTSLELEAGVEMQFAEGRSLTVNGSFYAQGIEGNPVTFTAQDKTPGSWRGLVFTLQSTGTNKRGPLPPAIEDTHPISKAITLVPVKDPTLAQEERIYTALDSRVVLNNTVVEYATIGILAESDNISIENSLITNNLEAGIKWYGRERSASGEMKNNQIVNNMGWGAHLEALCVTSFGFASPLIEDNIFDGNATGGLYLFARGGSPSSWQRTVDRAFVSPQIKGNIFRNNQGFAIDAFARGIFTRGIPFNHSSFAQVEPQLEYNVFHDNEGAIRSINARTIGSAGFRMSFADVTVNQSTFWKSGSPVFSLADTSSITMKNSIVWGGNNPGVLIENAGELNASYSILSPFILEGEGNLTRDPLFVNPNAGDFTLQAGSPAIDAGDPSSPKDPDNTVADMGAFFFLQNQAPIIISTIADIELIAGGDSFMGDMAFLFSDPEGDSLQFRASSADRTIAQVLNTENVFEVRPLQTGQTVITLTAEDTNGLSASTSFSVNIPTSVGTEEASQLPTEFAIRQNYPNPFSTVTYIQYDVPESSLVTLRVHNLLGKQVDTLVDKPHAPGRYMIEWDASGMGSGVYIYRMQAGGFSETRKVLLVK